CVCTHATDININKLSADDFKALDNIISERVEDGTTPAVALAIFQRDTPLLNAAWGSLAPDEHTQATQTSTLFDLASLTKLYTTIAFLSLVSEEKLYLHTPVVNVIPEFGKINPRPMGGGQDPHSKELFPVNEDFAGQSVDVALVNCFHLLTHTSGLPAWRDVYTVADAPVEPPADDPLTQSERWSKAIERLVSYDFIAPPEHAVIYSDIGLMLLGEIVRRTHDENGTLEDAIKARVLGDRFPNTLFNPLRKGFTQEQIAPTEQDTTWRQRRVHGEVHDENAHGVGGIAGHAGLFSTAMEVALLGNIWLNHSERMLRIDPELAGASVELQAQTGADRRGLGWMLKSAENSSAGDYLSASSYGHTGFTGTSLWIDPDNKLSIALLTNRVYNGREHIGIHALRRAVHDAIGKALT
ncbi:MAG: serine hydrolase, partial [Chloroflexota bacterium]